MAGTSGMSATKSLSKVFGKTGRHSSETHLISLLAKKVTKSFMLNGVCTLKVRVFKLLQIIS